MSYFDLIPEEIKDKIFLSLDFEDILTTREYQSEYVKYATQSTSIILARRNKNLANEKWIQMKYRVYGILYNDPLANEELYLAYLRLPSMFKSRLVRNLPIVNIKWINKK